MRYICDADGCHTNTFKVLKILDLSEYTDITSAYAFIEVCVYYRTWIKNFAQVAVPIYQLLRNSILFVWDEKQAKTMDILNLALTTLPALVSLDYSEGASDIIFAIDTSLE